MKVGVIGKGGSGKTVIAGVLARYLARAGREVIALDCDANPNLGISLGIGLEATERLAAIRQSLEDGGAEHAPSASELLERRAGAGRGATRGRHSDRPAQPGLTLMWCFT